MELFAAELVEVGEGEHEAVGGEAAFQHLGAGEGLVAHDEVGVVFQHMGGVVGIVGQDDGVAVARALDGYGGEEFGDFRHRGLDEGRGEEGFEGEDAVVGAAIGGNGEIGSVGADGAAGGIYPPRAVLGERRGRAVFGRPGGVGRCGGAGG